MPFPCCWQASILPAFRGFVLYWENGSISRKHLIHLVIGTLVTVGCLYWAVKDINWGEVGSSFSRARYSTIPFYLLLLFAFYWLKALRWTILLAPVKAIPPSQLGGPMMVGFMGNNVLPAHLGELFRVLLVAREQRVSFAGVFSSVAIERLFDIFAVLLLVAVGLVGVRDLPASFEKSFQAVGLMAVIAVIGLVAGLIWLKHAIALAKAMIVRLPVAAMRKDQLQRMVDSAAVATGAVKDGNLLVMVVVNSLVQWSCNCVMIYISLWSFGIQVPLTATFILLGVLVFAVTIPSTPGFFGAIQLAFVKTLALFGVAESDAFAASIYYHLLQYLAVTGVGLVCLWRSGATLTGLQHDAEELENQAGEQEPTGTAAN